MTTIFELWNPIIDDDLLGCHFDVTPGNIYQLGAGTLELVTDFLRCLNIDNSVQDWHIDEFCSSYYSRTRQEYYQDRHPLAWKVKVSFQEPCSEYIEWKLHFFEPIICENIDLTWQEEEDSWDWTSNLYIMIADFIPSDWEKLENDFGQNKIFSQCRGVETKYLERYVIHARFNLGIINFPEEEERVVEFMRVLEQYDASLNWAKTNLGW